VFPKFEERLTYRDTEFPQFGQRIDANKHVILEDKGEKEYRNIKSEFSIFTNRDLEPSNILI
jgi:hypothetical protein